MKKAVISVGGSQHFVGEGDKITVNRMNTEKDLVELTPLMVVDGSNSILDGKNLENSKVKATVLESDIKADKVVSIRYKAKKRVNTKRGHRQPQTVLEIKSIG